MLSDPQEAMAYTQKIMQIVEHINNTSYVELVVKNRNLLHMAAAILNLEASMVAIPDLSVISYNKDLVEVFKQLLSAIDKV